MESKVEFFECSFNWEPRHFVDGPKFAQLNVYFPPEVRADTKVQLIPLNAGTVTIDFGVTRSAREIRATLTTQETWDGEPVKELLASPTVRLQYGTGCEVELVPHSTI